MKYLCFSFILFLITAPPLLGGATHEPPEKSNSGVALSEKKWFSVVTEFENSVFSLSQWLKKCQIDKQKTQNEIEDLEKKNDSLRKGTAEGSNLFDEFRLKGLLSDLKEKLENQSQLQHQWDSKQKEFEQKALSLTALYNDRIEMELETTYSSMKQNEIDNKLTDLTLLVQKRTQIQTLLREYGEKPNSENLLSVSSFKPFKTDDRESLQLTLDLFRDRKKDLDEQSEKWSLEIEEVKNELKLQGKMQDFLEDIRQINEDSDFPQGGLKRHDLEGLVGKNQKNKLELRLIELQKKINQGQGTLSQITLLMSRVQNQINSLDEGKRP